MSSSELPLEIEYQEAAATEICVQAGILTRCKDCGVAYNPSIFDIEDASQAYAIGTNLLKKDDELTKAFRGDRKLMTDTIKKVCEDPRDQCECQDQMDRYMAKDD